MGKNAISTHLSDMLRNGASSPPASWVAFDLQCPHRKTVPICLYLGIVAMRDGVEAGVTAYFALNATVYCQARLTVCTSIHSLPAAHRGKIDRDRAGSESSLLADCGRPKRRCCIEEYRGHWQRSLRVGSGPSG